MKKAYGRHGNTDKDSLVLKKHLFSGNVLWTPRCVFSSAPLCSKVKAQERCRYLQVCSARWPFQRATCKISLGSYIDIVHTEHASSHIPHMSKLVTNSLRPWWLLRFHFGECIPAVCVSPRADVMWCDVAASVPTGKLSRRRSQWFPGALSAACSTSGYCTWVRLLFMFIFFFFMCNMTELREVKTLRIWIIKNQKEKCGGGRRVSVQTSSTNTLCYSFWFKNRNSVLHEFKLYMIFLKLEDGQRA